jgi:hypothetical protein
MILRYDGNAKNGKGELLKYINNSPPLPLGQMLKNSSTN